MTDNNTASNASPDKPSVPSSNVFEYVVSWKWLLGGLLLLFVCGGACGGLYYLRCSNLAEHVLTVSRKMMTEAMEMRKSADEEPDRKKRDEIILDSYRMRENVADLLRNYNESLQTVNPDILRELNDALESMYGEKLYEPRSLRLRRIEGLIQNCQNIIMVTSTNSEAFRYHIRLMELEWERYGIARRSEWAESALSRASAVYTMEQELTGQVNYSALKIMTLISLSRIGALSYAPVAGIPYMDQLLEKVYQINPSDLDICPRYAEFIVAVDRAEFRDCASEELRKMPPEERLEKALRMIDGMVAANADEPRAYMGRFMFRKLFAPRPQDLNSTDLDIQAILKIDPENPLGLLQAAAEKANQAQLARRDNNDAVSRQRKQEAEDYFKKAIEVQPSTPLAYQWYGEFKLMFGDLDETIEIWKQGIEKSPPHNEELIGRLTLALLEQRRYEEAGATIRLLGPAVQEAWANQPSAVTPLRNLSVMLTAMLNDGEAREARVKGRAAQRVGQMEESRRYFALAVRKSSDASQELGRLFDAFGITTHDFVVDENTIFASVLPRALMLAGQLQSDSGKWDKAATSYEKAARFKGFQVLGAVAAANAYQNNKQSGEALTILKAAVDANPQNTSLRFNYSQIMFNDRIRHSGTTPEQFAEVEKELKTLEESRDQLARPWLIDLRRVQLEMVRDSRSGENDRVLQAASTALRRFRELENKEFPEVQVQKNPEKKVYSDDLEFLSELAGLYSSLSALSDFDRILDKLHDLPGGEIVYFSQRVGDALRRKDREGAILIIEEAMSSDLLTSAQKQTFLPSLENLKSDDIDSMKSIYNQLKNIFDDNPDSMSERLLFAYANMAIDQKDYKLAKDLQNRLEVTEKETGTYWRYIKALLILTEPKPDFEAVRNIAAEINRYRNEKWDMGFILQAMVEEQYLRTNPDDKAAKARMMQAYTEAIRCGTTLSHIWNRLYAIYQAEGMTKEAQALRREAFIRDISIGTTPGQFPQPYQGMVSKVQQDILDEKFDDADTAARQCVMLATSQRENPEMIFSLNLNLGSIFMQADLFDSAIWHLEPVAKRGGTFVYPLAACLAKAKRVDEGVTLILDEIDRMPSSAGLLVPSLMILISQVTPSEAVFQRIDKLITRIENGEPQIFRGTIENSGEARDLPFGEKRIRSLVIRFPESEDLPDASDIEFFPPYDGEEDETEETTPTE